MSIRRFSLLVALASLLAASSASAACVGALQANNNLADVCNAAAARSALGVGTGDGSVTSVAAGAGMSFSTITTTGTVAASSGARTRGIEFVIDGGGSAITSTVCSFTAGQLCTLHVPMACTITNATLIGDGQSGSAVIEVASVSRATFISGTIPTSGNKITASAPPTISSAKASSDSTLTGWTTSVAADTIMAFSVTSATTLTRVTVSLTCLVP